MHDIHTYIHTSSTIHDECESSVGDAEMAWPRSAEVPEPGAVSDDAMSSRATALIAGYTTDLTTPSSRCDLPALCSDACPPCLAYRFYRSDYRRRDWPARWESKKSRRRMRRRTWGLWATHSARGVSSGPSCLLGDGVCLLTSRTAGCIIIGWVEPSRVSSLALQSRT